MTKEKRRPGKGRRLVCLGEPGSLKDRYVRILHAGMK
jgi:hypothetical protein